MSHNQSRAERTDSTHYRKTGRSITFNQQRQSSGSVFSEGGGASSAAIHASNRSLKKYDINTPGVQSKPRSPIVSTTSSNSFPVHADQNGAHQQQQSYRVSDAPVTSPISNIKPTDATSQQINQAVSRGPSSNVSVAAPPSNISTASSGSKATITPEKSIGDASRSFPLQFGSISPGFMNKMQIPARTSSAPPNLDEQKKDQARHDSMRNVPAIPPPSIPKQNLTKKDAGGLDQSIVGEAHPMSKPRRDTQVSVAPAITQTQKPSVLPIHGIPMHLPFHQPQVSTQFGGLSPPIQSSPMSGTPLQLPMSMPLSMGNLPVQQPMFVSGLQPHQMHSQGIVHQGQMLNFSQMGHQLPPQMGNMGGMNMVPQYPQQQAGKYSGSRKTVKITHPETHEELKLDGSSGPKSHSNVLPQSQLVPSFPSNHPMNFYPDSYTHSLFFPAASSAPLNSSQVPATSQPPRFYGQVTVKPGVGSHGDKVIIQPTNSLSAVKIESSKPSKLYMEDPSRPQKDNKPLSLSILPELKPGSGTPFTSTSSCPVNVQSDVPDTSSFVLASSDGFAMMSTSSSEEPSIGVIAPNSIKDNHEKIDVRAVQDQVGRQPTSISKFPSELSENEAVEARSISVGANLVAETASSEVTYSSKEGAAEEKFNDRPKSLVTKYIASSQLRPDTMGRKEQRESKMCESSEPDRNSLDTSMRSLSLESSEISCKIEENSVQVDAASSDYLLEHVWQKPNELFGCCLDDAKGDDNVFQSSHTEVCGEIESSVAVNRLFAQDVKTSISDVLLSIPVNISTGDSKNAMVEQESTSVLVLSAEGASKHDNEDDDINSSALISPSEIPKGKILSDANVAKSVIPRGKRKKKELYRKAEAAGTSSDMYMAYKCPEEKTEIATSAEGAEKMSNISVEQTSVDVPQDIALSSENTAQSKTEPDDWEDAAEISSPQLETLNQNEVYDGDDNELRPKRYSPDFLFKFKQQCTDLPEGFEIPSDIADALLVSSVLISRESHPSSGRNIDRPIGGSRLDRRGSGLGDEDKWSKVPGLLVSGKGDMRADAGYAGNVSVFRNGQGGNHGVLRNPRVQTTGQHSGGILSGPMQSLGPQGGLQRNNSDSDRWQRGTVFQKGLIHSPQSPLQFMHKAEIKYEVGKVTDEEEVKQRQLKSILNKLTPQNFEKLFEQVKQVGIDNVVTLTGVISQIFDKALMEPTFCEMYASFCFCLAAVLPNLTVENEKITFKRLLLDKCQEEFERGEREEEEANKKEEKGEHSAEEREEKKVQARRRMLGNFRLIGELYKKKMLTERIVHECINKLLGEYQSPDEENIEALCKLMSTIGEMIDHSKAKEHMDAYFDIMAQLSNNIKLSSRVRFMLKDVIDLRKNKWQQRRKVEGPKKIDEVHRDAAQERQAQASRLNRAPSIGGSVRRGPPMDLAPRTPSMLTSQSSQMGSFPPVQPQLPSYGSQDVRIEERHSLDNRNLSVTLPQRPLGDESITLGPQGGLARGMAFRGQPSPPSIPLPEMSIPGDARGMGPGPNGFSSMLDRTAYGRFTAPSIYDQSHFQERNASNGNKEIRNAGHGFDISLPATSLAHGGPPITPEIVLSEELLRDKSIAAIKEFYSARDENEVALCIKELNAPSFYPSMISIWVTDSFERKEMERDILTKLLISLAKRRDDIINEYQLTKGFESVLSVLEDAINDAPRAAEFLGRILAQVILENIISLSEISQLIYEGGEEQGRLVEVGLAAEVLGSILEIIKSEKGDSVLNEIQSNSNLQLEKFRPPISKKSLRIDKFI